LIDRGERQLPIAAQYAGATLSVPAGKLLRLARDKAGKLSLKLSDARPSDAKPSA
jgi:pyrimidine operon attenuation protein/uracil phosphoribosyltransferase